MFSTVLRRGSRAFVLALGLGLVMLAAPASAEPPSTWDEPSNGSLLDNLLILVGIPLAIIALITLLVYLPSMMRGQSSEPALAFQDHREWFGGPRKGVDATSAGSAEDTPDKGGASARW